VRGDLHAGFCESRGVRFPPATLQTPINVIASAYLVAVGTFVFREPFPSDPVFLALRLIGFAGILTGTILLAGGKSDTAGFAAVQAIEPDLGLGPVLEGELESLGTHAEASGPTDPAGHGD